MYFNLWQVHSTGLLGRLVYELDKPVKVLHCQAKTINKTGTGSRWMRWLNGRCSFLPSAANNILCSDRAPYPLLQERAEQKASCPELSLCYQRRSHHFASRHFYVKSAKLCFILSVARLRRTTGRFKIAQTEQTTPKKKQLWSLTQTSALKATARCDGLSHQIY